MGQIYDPIRKKWVASYPEEMVRQHLILHMIDRLHYPPHLIAVEKELAGLAPHLKTQKRIRFPKRRIDIIVFSSQKLHPLLLIECKAAPLTEEFATQVIGYNAFVGAPFIALANEEKVLCGAYDPDISKYRFESGLPYFEVINLR
jgi:hypothetical protein